MAKIGNHAAVLGASMAGLLAARALSDFFETVTVVERDVLPDSPANRRGVPQGRHPHGLLTRGAQVLEELFPGLLDELVLAGAPYFDGRDLSKLHYNLGGHRVVSTGSAEDFTAYVSTRPFLEYHVRRRVRAVGNVTLLDDHDVVELRSTPDRGRITGVRTVNRRSREESTLAADLVVDATGRGARTPAWLESLGYGRPVEEHVVVHLTYASQALRMPPGALHEMAFVIGVVPGRPTGMFLVGCENDTWLFTAMGIARREPPCERTAMYEFAENFTPAHVLAALRPPNRSGRWHDTASRPASGAATTRCADSRRPSGLRRRDLRLQPDLWARHDGGRIGSVGAAGLLVPRRRRPVAAILPSRGTPDPPSMATGRRRRPCPARNRRRTTAGDATVQRLCGSGADRRRIRRRRIQSVRQGDLARRPRDPAAAPSHDVACRHR